MSISLSFVIHLSVDLIVPKLVAGPEYFAVKGLISTFLFYIFIPSATIWFNESMCLYIELELISKLTLLWPGNNRVSPAVSLT